MDRYRARLPILLFYIILWNFLLFSPFGEALAKKTDFENLEIKQRFESTEQTVPVFAKIVPKSIFPGEELSLQIIGRIDQDRHLYSIRQQGEFAPNPTRIVITSPFVTATSKMDESPTVLINDEAFETPLQVHKNDFWISRRYHLLKKIEPGSYQLTGYLLYQICSNRICSLPLKSHFIEPLTINSR